MEFLSQWRNKIITKTMKKIQDHLFSVTVCIKKAYFYYSNSNVKLLYYKKVIVK